MGLFANQPGIRFFRRALESAQECPEGEGAEQDKRIRLALGELLVSTGQYDEAAQHLEAALTLAQVEPDPLAQARACRFLGRSCELQGQYTQSVIWLEQGLAASERLDSAEEAEISLIAGLVHLRQGAYDKTWALCERSLAIANKLGDAAVRARTYNLMGYVQLRLGEITALDRFRQSLVQYEKLENVYGQATSLNMIGFSLRCQGQWTLADEQYQKSLALFRQMGDFYNQVGVLNNLGELARKQGRLEVALDYYRKALGLLEHTGGSSWLFGLLGMNMANAFIRLAQLTKATLELEKARDLFEQAELRDLLPELHSLFAEVAFARGDLDRAEEIGHHSVELARDLKMRREQGHNLRIMGEIAQAKQELDCAKKTLSESHAILCEVDDIYERTKARLSLAHLQLEIGELDTATAGLDECELTFSKLGARLDLDRVTELRKRLPYPVSKR
jgi:tetratricopeptide (TPR) repeat protein